MLFFVSILLIIFTILPYMVSSQETINIKYGAIY